MIKRTLLLPKKHGFFLFGPRQTGKSTLLQYTIKDKKHTLYIDLLDTTIENIYLLDPNTLYREVINNTYETIVIDEIQKVPKLLDEVQRLMEKRPEIQFILCGSSARKLKRMHANLLAGRALLYVLAPLSFNELDKSFNLIRALEIGMLPPVYLENDHSIAKQILRSYVNTYLSEEIKQEAVVRNLGAFLKFLPLAGSESGNIINFSNISREIGVSYKTVQEYFQILIDTLVGAFLQPFKKSIRKKLISHPKFYFFDTGVLRAIRNELSIPLEPKTSTYGIMFEHFVINEIIALNNYQQLDLNITFYRTTTGQEIDIIIEKPDKSILAIEIKAKDHIQTSDMRTLNNFKQFCPDAKLYVISTVKNTQQYGNVTIVPWQEMASIIS